jgi:uncharacterized protein YggE
MHRSIVVALLCSFGCALNVSAQTIQINRDNKTVAVSATDEASMTADIAAVSIGFDVFGPDSEHAYADGARLSHSIMEALHKAGIKDDEISSSEQSLERTTNFDDKDSEAFRAAHQFKFQQAWEVSVPPAAVAGVIRVAVAAGANKSGSIDWRLSDRKALQARAAANALVKARAIATNMADGLHVRLGALIYASNQTPNTNIFFMRKGQNTELNTSSATVAVVEEAPPLEIRPQTIREEATVYAVFAIE